jgi:hypothetical protein|tara:strand:- start:194 stop:331 length:138 start_codon:yes stop_codon:yes gene_type:complete
VQKTERQPGNAHCPSWVFLHVFVFSFVLVFAALVKVGQILRSLTF